MTVMASTSYADLHIHTCHSDGWPTPVAVVDHVRWAGRLHAIAITDHDTIEGALLARDYAAELENAPLVIVGEEVSTLDGHVLGLFLTEHVSPGLPAAATVEAIHAQGGVAVAAHPFWRPERPDRNGHRIHGVGWKATDTPFDAIEVENATPGFYLFNQMAHRMQEECGLAGVGSSDAHILEAIGRAQTGFPGSGEAALRRALARGTTTAHRVRYQPRGLAMYMAWGLHHHAMKRASRLSR